MKLILMVYLIMFKGYSVIRMRYDEDGHPAPDGIWGACDSVLEFDYGHSGRWAWGVSAKEASYNCWAKPKRKRIYKGIKNEHHKP